MFTAGSACTGTYRALKLWEAAVTEAGSLDQDDVIAALDHARITEGPGGPAEMVPGQHHVRMNMYIAQARAGRSRWSRTLAHRSEGVRGRPVTYGGQMFPDLTSGNICADASMWSVRRTRKPAQRVGRPSNFSRLRRSRLVGRPVPRSRAATATASSRGGGEGLLSV